MKPTGGSAFPALLELQGKHSSEADLLAVSSGGMTLRDYFAGQYIAGRAARYEIDPYGIEAEVAYQIADAMLAEREK